MENKKLIRRLFNKINKHNDLIMFFIILTWVVLLLHIVFEFLYLSNY